jgi:hypothetical protein
MPRDDRYPTPLLNMSPSGFAGFLVIVAMSLALAKMVGGYYVLAWWAVVSAVAVVAALVIRSWRTHQSRDKSLLHLEPPLQNGKARNE